MRTNQRIRRSVTSWLAVLMLVGGGVLTAAAPAESPLVAAARAADLDLVRALLGLSADVDARAVDGMTALHWAVQRDALEMTAALLEAGADVGATNRYGVTALTLAATNGNAAIVAVLLAAGADVSARLAGGETALMTAARTSDLTATDPGGAFSREVGLTRPARSGPSFTALLFAAQLGQHAAARALLAAGADVNDAFPDGTSALVVAAMNGHFELGVFLIDQGADVHAATQGWNALHQTIRLRRTNIGHMPPPDGHGTLSSLDLIHALIAAGIDVHAPMTADFRDGYRNRLNRIGATPFLLASKNVDTEVMRVLLEAGADPLVPNADLTTPLMVAAGVDMWNPGEDGGATQEDEPEALEAVTMLVELGNDVQAANDRGETALHGAAYRGAPSVVEYLVEQGAEIDARSDQGWTPWTIANGVFYSLFYKEQPQTADVLAALMAARGISTDGMADELRTCFDCGRNRRTLRDKDGKRVAQPTPDRVPGQDTPEQQAAPPPE